MNKSQLMITAHSGCEGTGIDTMESIEKALEFGADAIEIDIRMDPFGELRISHDPLSLEDYLRKNLLADVFQIVRPTSLLINFDIKEEAVLYKTLEAARNFGFPTDRLVFTGCTNPVQLTNDTSLADRANFFLNLEEVLKYIYVNRKDEFGREIFLMLMEDPYIILIEEGSRIPDIYLSDAVKLHQKIYAVSRSLRERVFEDMVRTYQETMAAAANIPKFLLRTGTADLLKAGNIPLSVWTVNEPELVRLCIEKGVYNITTRKVSAVRQILDQYAES